MLKDALVAGSQAFAWGPTRLPAEGLGFLKLIKVNATGI
jgi:hypothetical protein